jgi:hypothetical protein
MVEMVLLPVVLLLVEVEVVQEHLEVLHLLEQLVTEVMEHRVRILDQL